MRQIAWIIAFFCLVHTALATDVPTLTGPINDYAKVLTADQVKTLSDRLLNNEHQTTDQVVVLIISSLNGQDIESYAHDVFHTWGLGAKKEVNKPGNNGVLLVVAINDHKMRIEVGYGMEGSLTDAASGQIIRNTLAPAFKQQHYFEGITDGVSEIEKAISGQPLSASLAPPKSTTYAGSALNNIGAGWLILDIILLLVLFIICMSTQNPPAGGVIGAVGSFLIAICIFSFGTAFIIGLVGFVVGLIAACIDPDSIGSGGSGGGFGGGWDSGGSSDSGGGGYSGGGGDSGGGGASGSW